MSVAHTWVFRTSFRRHAYSWNGTRKAIERLHEAISEIQRVARADPALGGEGAVLLLEKLSPAICQVDSSSGALGNAAANAVEDLVPLIAKAPVSSAVREKWLDRLLAAMGDDDPPYIESLGQHWGALCADPALASDWADQLLPLVKHVMADRRKGSYAYAKSATPCYSALFHAGRFDDLLAVLALDPKPYWRDQHWAAKALAARGDVDGAVNLLEGLRSSYAPDSSLSAAAEQLLLEAGRSEEAYARYAIQATEARTNIATFRAIAKRFSAIAPGRILGDLIASTPGQEGKWFATAKTLKQYELAIALARQSPVDPKTLVRAARDHVKSQPAFALEVAVLALYWLARGEGFEPTGADVVAARDQAVAAAAALAAHGIQASADERIVGAVAGDGSAARWVRQCLGISNL